MIDFDDIKKTVHAVGMNMNGLISKNAAQLHIFRKNAIQPLFPFCFDLFCKTKFIFYNICHKGH